MPDNHPPLPMPDKELGEIYKLWLEGDKKFGGSRENTYRALTAAMNLGASKALAFKDCPSPVTRSKEIEDALWALKCHGPYTSTTLTRGDANTLELYIAQLEASQPNVVSIPALSCKETDGKLASPKPQSDAGPDWVSDLACNLISYANEYAELTTAKDYESIIRAALSRQAPVPTSGALEAFEKWRLKVERAVVEAIVTHTTPGNPTMSPDEAMQRMHAAHYLQAFRKAVESIPFPVTTPPAAEGKQALPQIVVDALAERNRQQEVEGWTPEHDDQHTNGEMARAAAAYAFAGAHHDPILRERCQYRMGICGSSEWVVVSGLWPWDWKWWKVKTPRRDIERAIALLIAEGERLDRLAQPASGGAE